jgi:hypothetical protein
MVQSVEVTLVGTVSGSDAVGTVSGSDAGG